MKKWVTKKDNEMLEKAWGVTHAMQTLRMRPMLLAYIKDLMEAKITTWREYAIYRALMEYWLLREERKTPDKPITKENLWQACQVIAMFLQATGKRLLAPSDLDTLLEKYPVAKEIEALEVSGRSLLNRTSDGNFRFAHYSIQEFLVAYNLVEGSQLPDGLVRGTDQILSFIFSYVAEAPRERMPTVKWERLDLQGIEPPDIDFSGLDLTEMKLPEVLLRKGDLSKTNLRGSDLRGANLMKSMLMYADLRAADLEGADLRGASLGGSDLREAKLGGANFMNASIAGANLNDMDLRDTLNLHGAVMVRTSLMRNKLSDLNLSGANLESANLQSADLRRTNLSRADLSRADLRGANLREVNLSGARLSLADFRGADLRNANIEGAHLWSAKVKDANLEGVTVDTETRKTLDWL